MTIRYLVTVVFTAWLVASCGQRCPDYGIRAPGSYTVLLDTAIMGSRPCSGVDALATGDAVPVHFEMNNLTVARCQGWINQCGTFNAGRFNITGPRANAPFVGTFDATLAGGCTGELQASITDSGGAATLFYFERSFSPDDTTECHAQFGSFVGTGNTICTDTWLGRVMSASP